MNRVLHTSSTGRPARLRSTGQEGTAFPVFRDHHVHLGLFDPGGLPRTGIGAVVDLGWSPDVTALAARAPVHADFAAQFLTAPDGYPSDRAWAPHASVRPVAGPGDAAGAVSEQVALGATVVKMVLNRDDGPVPDLATCSAVVEAAGDLPVVAHVQGAGMVELAHAAGISTLAHTPWTHLLDADVIGECVEAGQRWISTLDIHGYGERTPDQAVALANLAAFHAAGGSVLYGTDLGNGPLPPGLNVRELHLLVEAGLDAETLLGALTAPWPGAASDDVLTFVPGDPRDQLVGWLTGAVAVPLDDVELL